MKAICNCSNIKNCDLDKIKKQYDITENERKKIKKQCFIAEKVMPAITVTIFLVIYLMNFKKIIIVGFFATLIISIIYFSLMFSLMFFITSKICPLYIAKDDIKTYIENVNKLDSYKSALDFQEYMKNHYGRFSQTDKDIFMEMFKMFGLYIRKLDDETISKIIKGGSFDFSWIDEEVECLCKKLENKTFKI